MFDKLEDLLIRFEEIMGELNEPDVTANQERFRALMKEQSDLTPIVEAYREYKKCNQDIEDSLMMLDEENDPDMREMLKEELNSAKTRVSELVTEQELAEAKRGLIEYRAVNRAQDGTLAGSWINFMESGRDWSFSKDMEVAIEKLTVKDVNAAIRRIADPSKMTFVLAADLAKAREAGKDFSKQ